MKKFQHYAQLLYTCSLYALHYAICYLLIMYFLYA